MGRPDGLDVIIRNQLGRRNCKPEHKRYLLGKRLLAEKKREGAPKDNKNAVKDDEKQLSQIETVVLPETKPKRTSERLAEEYGVSRSSIDRDAIYAKAVDEFAKRKPHCRRDSDGTKMVLSNVNKTFKLENQKCQISRTAIQARRKSGNCAGRFKTVGMRRIDINETATQSHTKRR